MKTWKVNIDTAVAEVCPLARLALCCQRPFQGLILAQPRPCLSYCLVAMMMLVGCGREEVYTDRAKDPAYRQEMTALHDKQVELTAKQRELKKKLTGMVRTKENADSYDTLAAEERRVADEIENARKWARMRADVRRAKELEDREKVKKGLAVAKATDDQRGRDAPAPASGEFSERGRLAPENGISSNKGETK